MRGYITRRLLLIIPTVLLATLMVFFVVRLIPGDIIDLMIAENPVGTTGDVTRQALEHDLGLDVPIHVQYVQWLGDIFLHGDLGDSLWTSTSVTEEILSRLPVTFELGLMALVVALLIAIPIGVYSAIRQDTVGDYIARSFAILCIAVPGFWLGTMVVVFPSLWWGWSPPIMLIPFTEDPMGNLGMFILPAVVLGMAMAGVTMRMSRTMMLEVLRQDYIRTAWSKGLRERVVIMRHALKNALMPVITIVGLQVPILIGGAVIIEQIFCLPGIGRLVLNATFARDYPIVTGVMFVMALFILVVNLIVDLTYAYLDPRVQYR
ncbi:MAG: ABC transporter permease [Dehalococcoidia bacterium]|nr:ABC transporter permease [Dehalococcoidia bacterium]